ncbi:MAG: M20/M25/M40 family metallo-hydrolase, partial [Clostridium sp.]
KETTCNIGIVEGGIASNVVMPSVKIVFEARSLDEEKLDHLIKNVREVFEVEARKMNGGLNFNVKKGTPGFFIDENEEVIKEFKKKCEENNIECKIKPCGGGSDTNIFNKEGIKSVILGVGMEKVHTKEEYIKIEDLENMEKLLLSLI